MILSGREAQTKEPLAEADPFKESSFWVEGYVDSGSSARQTIAEEECDSNAGPLWDGSRMVDRGSESLAGGREARASGLPFNFKVDQAPLWLPRLSPSCVQLLDLMIFQVVGIG